jgi:hypothetical protein
MEEKSASALAPVIDVIPVSFREYGSPEEYFGRIEGFLEGFSTATGQRILTGLTRPGRPVLVAPGKAKICPVLSDSAGNNCPKGTVLLSFVLAAVQGEGGRNTYPFVQEMQ